MMKKATYLRLLITAAIALLVSDGAQSWQFNPGALKDYQDGVSQLALTV
jgi:hypothetical protein